MYVIQNIEHFKFMQAHNLEIVSMAFFCYVPKYSTVK